MPRHAASSPGWPAVVAVLALLAALAALIVGSVALNRALQGQAGLLQAVVTQDGTVAPLLANKLQLRGTSGLESFVQAPDLVSLDNLRDLTPYTVDAAGGSEYLTPQEAYAAALADGRGGDNGAVIMIAPGEYAFGDALFEINTSNIVFASLTGAAGLAGAVVFSASGPGGGLLINVPPALYGNAIFQGIAFGAPGDATGFLLRLARGSLALMACTTQDSNMRVVAGGAPMGEYVTFSAFLCRFSPLPPADFFTSLDGQVQLFLSSCQWVQLGFGAPVSAGGALFNLSQGLGEMRVLQSFMVLNHYDAVVAGPLPDVSAGERVALFQACNVATLGTNPQLSFVALSGPFSVQIIECAIQVPNAVFYQARDCNAGDDHGVYVVGGGVYSSNATVLYAPGVSVVGTAQYYFANSLVQSNAPLIFVIAGATAPDAVGVTLSGCTLRSGGAPLSDYALGPGALLGALNVGSSSSLNGANGQTGFTYNALTAL